MWNAIRCEPGVVAQAEQWGWSSAGVRFGLAATPVVLDWMGWRERFTPERWRVMLASDTLSAAEDRLRASTYTGRPVGEESFVREAERTLNRTLQRRKGGRPRKVVDEEGRQAVLFTEAAGHNGCAKGGNMRAVPEFPPEFPPSSPVPEFPRQEYTSITIQTSPEETQKVIQYIRTHSDGDYRTYSNNCTTTCAKILRTLSLYKKNSITPKGFFTDLLQQYGASKSVPNNIQHGTDYGKPRSGYDAFSLLFLSIQNQESAAKKPKEVIKTKICYSGDDGKQHCDSGN